MPTATVRVYKETHATIRELAKEEGVSMREMLDRILRWYFGVLRERQEAAPERGGDRPV